MLLWVCNTMGRKLRTSLRRLATTAPADPPPATMKSYSESGARRDWKWPHGSSTSHCVLRNCSRRAMNMMMVEPPQVATEGPGVLTVHWLAQSISYNTYHKTSTSTDSHKNIANKSNTLLLACREREAETKFTHFNSFFS